MRRLVVGTALAAGAAAQELPQQPASGVDANYVRVDMYATQAGSVVGDLRLEEIELLEDGVPQKVEALDRIGVAGGGERRPGMLVVFMDTLHVAADDLQEVQRRLPGAIDKAIGDDDLLGLAHPRSARNPTFGPKRSTAVRLADSNRAWGARPADAPLDPVEQRWFECYGPGDRFEEMRARRRGRISLEALGDLVAGLGRAGRAGEGRKAVLLVSEGWQLFAPERRSRRPTNPDGAAGGKAECEAARAELSTVDIKRGLRDLIGQANRANTSFYAVPPGSGRPMPYIDSLRELAAATDGIAVQGLSEIDAAARRIASDLDFYYLIAYHSTNTRTDGGLRSISVRVKRPGVTLRTRTGYRALTAEQAAALRAQSVSASTTAAAASHAVSGILHRPDDMVNPVNLASLRHVVLWKRGPATGREYVASDDARVRRTDRLRVEHATAAPGAVSARMIDGQGKPMPIPVQVSERPDPSGDYRWVVTEAALAALAPGEYAIELTVGELTVRTQFEVVP